MKNLLLTFLLLAGGFCFAGKTDSTFQRHQLSFSMTNAISHQFLRGPDGVSLRMDNNEFFGYETRKYLPNYGFHLRINYSLGISKAFRIETGIGYLLEGLTTKFQSEVGDFFLEKISYMLLSYQGSLTVPLHFKFMKAVKGGQFTCTLGPNFLIPIHSFERRTDYFENGIHEPDVFSHTGYGDSSIRSNSFLGFDLKMGYEKRLTKQLSIDMGPVVSFTNLLPLGKKPNDYYGNTNYLPFHYYIGLDVAVNFGLK